MSSLCISIRLTVFAVLAHMAFPACGLAAEPAPAPRSIYPRFDLTYMPEIGTQGLIGFRPVEIARHAKGPELEAVTQLFLLLFSQLFHDANLDVAEPPNFASIEQCVFDLQLHVEAPTGKERGTFFLGGTTPCVIRTVHPFDWDALARKWFPKAVQKRLAGRMYLRVKVDIPSSPDASPKEAPFEYVMGIFIPDDRTLVVADEEDIFELLDRLAARKPAPVAPPGWSEVDRDFAALVLDVREERPVTGRFPADYPWGKDLHKFVDSCQTLAVGLSVGNRTHIRLVGTAKDAASARTATKSLQRLLKAANKQLAKEEDGILKTFTTELLDGVIIESNGLRFTASTSADHNIFELLLSVIHGPD